MNVYDQIRRSLRSRFKPLSGLPWFEALVEQYVYAFERDDEYGEKLVLDALIESAMMAGVADPGAECWDCEEPKLELRYSGQCNSCTEAEQERAEARAARPPETIDGHTLRIYLHGLISRNVQ